MPTVRVPRPLRACTGGRGQVDVDGADVGAVLDALVDAHPALGDRLREADGDLRRFVNVFVGDEDIRLRDGLATPVAPDDVLSIVPAVAGGADQQTVSGRHPA